MNEDLGINAFAQPWRVLFCASFLPLQGGGWVHSVEIVNVNARSLGC